MNLKSSFSVLKNIFSNWKYVFITVIFAFIFYMLNVLILDITTVHAVSTSVGLFSSIKTLFSLAFNLVYVIRLSSFITIILISILFGIFVSLLICKTNLNIQTKEKKASFLGWFAVFLAFLIPGCTICGVGLLSLFGLSAGALSFLPQKGLEISLLSIAILLFTIFKLSENMYACKTLIFNNSKEDSKDMRKLKASLKNKHANFTKLRKLKGGSIK